MPETGTLGIQTLFVNQSVGCYLDSLNANLQLTSSDIGRVFQVSLKIIKMTGDASTFYVTISHNDNKVDNIPITNDWVSHDIDITINTVNHDRIYIVMNPSTTPASFIIDDVIIREVTTAEETITQQIVNPEFLVTWNPSLNIIQTIPELGITTAGYYKLLIFDSPESDAQPIYESNQIQAIENAQGQHILYLGDEDIPHDTELICIVAAINPTQYGGGYVYSNTYTITGIPAAIDSFTLRWGEEEPPINIINGDANLDGAVNVGDIVALVGHILGENIIEQGSDAFVGADFNSDGVVNVIDIVQLVDEILS